MMNMINRMDVLLSDVESNWSNKFIKIIIADVPK